MFGDNFICWCGSHIHYCPHGARQMTPLRLCGGRVCVCVCTLSRCIDGEEDHFPTFEIRYLPGDSEGHCVNTTWKIKIFSLLYLIQG